MTYDVGRYPYVQYILDRAVQDMVKAWKASAYRSFSLPTDTLTDPDINLEQREGWAYDRR